MNYSKWFNERSLRICIIITLWVMVCHGFLTTFFVVEPFWIDEWRIIYNLKFKSVQGLWGPLEYLQQFPRFYLSLLKIFTETFDYSYSALRLPSFVVGSFSIFLAWRLMIRLYPKGDWSQYLFVIILVSSPPFTKYYLQVKQYTMDMALSLTAVWQGLELLRIAEGKPVNKTRYALLCTTFLIAPFFSYTYPICIAPAFVVMAIATYRFRMGGLNKLIKLWFPLVLCAGSIAAFYFLDVRQLLSDEGMQDYWKYNLPGALDTAGLLLNFYAAFSLVGSGFVFSTIFGILGSIAFVRATVQTFLDLRRASWGRTEGVRLFSVLLVMLVFALFLLGKLPLGEARLNAFIIVFVAILFIDLLQFLRNKFPENKWVIVPGIIIYLGVVGNIYTTLVANYNREERAKIRFIYTNTAQAIQKSKAANIPIIVTPGVAFPYDKDQNYPYKTTVPGDWVLKTHPAYKVSDNIAVYAVWELKDVKKSLDALPPLYRAAVITDGLSVSILHR